jgi:hypothetical protein
MALSRGERMSEIEFLANQANKVEGLAYAGFETFRGSPYTSCARETGQNSRDAATGQGAVRVSFNLLEIPRAEVPFADQLQASIESCLEDGRDDKTRRHLERALETVAADSIKVLEIADVNTTGLTGPVDDPRSVFTALVKGDGVTNKSDETSAGSYGIGKNAAYAVSDLQTVIYSTCYNDKVSGQKKFAAQGRLRLISHTEGTRKLSAEGYWGEPGFNAIENAAEVPAWIGRDQIGTTILSLGFREEAHWVDRMSLSLVTNFFLAIERREIEFSVNHDARQLSQASLDSVLAADSLMAVAESVGQETELTRARDLMRCIRSDVTTRYTIAVKDLGDFTLHLLVADGLPREVHILRNGIYICDNFSKFGLPMKRYPGTREFIAILEPTPGEPGKKPSQLLKQLENPAHDAFEPERIVDSTAQAKARTQIKGLIAKVRDIIRQIAKIDDISRSQLDELSHLFADGGTEKSSDDENAERDPERFRFGEAVKKEPARQPATGTGGGGGRKKRRKKRKSPPRIRKGTGQPAAKPQGPFPTVPLAGVRSLLPHPADPTRRSIFFTSDSTGELDVEIAASGLSDDVSLPLASASAGTITGGKLRLPVAAGKRNHVDVQFAEPFAGPIELLATIVRAGADAGAAS